MVADNTFRSSYQYIPKNLIGIDSDIPEILSSLEENILDFTANFSSGDFYKAHLEEIAKELESTAYYFGQQQGLETDKYGNDINLLDGIEATVFGHQIAFKNIAQDEYGRYYAGHVEYGHYSKNRKSYVPARPFMRPALYAVSKASTGFLGDVLADLAGGIFRRGKGASGYQGISELNFGTRLGKKYHKTTPSNYVVNMLKEKGGFSPKIAKNLSDNLSLVRGKSGFYQNRIRKRDANVRKEGTNLKRDKFKQKESNSSSKPKKPKSQKKSKFLPLGQIKSEKPSSKKQRERQRKKAIKRRVKTNELARNYVPRQGPFYDLYGKYYILNGKRFYV